MLNKILKNTSSNVSLLFVRMAVVFVMTPIYVSALGNHDYGVWEIVIATIGYMGLLDIGMKPTITRHVAKFMAEDDKTSLNELFSTSLFFMSMIGVTLGLIFFVWAINWPHILADVEGDYQKYSWMLMIIGIQLLFVFPGYVAESFFEGYQRYPLINNITIFNICVGSSLIYIYITPENALILIAALNATGLSLKYLLYFGLLARKKYGGYSFNLRAIKKLMLFRLLKFGGKSFVQGLGYQVESGSPPIVIGTLLGPAYVVFYVIPTNLAKYIRTLGWTITHVFLPVFSDLHGRKDAVAMRDVYLSYSRYVLGILLPIAISVFFVGSEFIDIWIGEEYGGQAGLVLQVVVIYFMLPFLNPFASRYLMAIDKHHLLAIIFPVVAIVNVTLAIIFVKVYGVIGVAYAAVLPLLFSVPYILYRTCRELELSLVAYIFSVWGRLIPPSVVSMLYFAIIESYLKIDGYLSFLFVVAGGVVSYAVVFFMVGLTQSERNIVLRKLM